MKRIDKMQGGVFMATNDEYIAKLNEVIDTVNEHSIELDNPWGIEACGKERHSQWECKDCPFGPCKQMFKQPAVAPEACCRRELGAEAIRTKWYPV